LGTRNTRQGLDITFPLLSDADLKTIYDYNVIQLPSEILARPAAYIIDEEGKIAWRDLGERFGHRTTSTQIITALQGL
jgi:peroxiredoxin